KLRHLRVLRENGLQGARTHLDGLLHHVIKSTVLDRRKAIDEVGVGCLLPGEFHQLQPHGLLADAVDPRTPFAVASVEDKKFCPLAHSQHVGEVMCLVASHLYLPILGKVLGHVQALHLVVGSHARLMRRPQKFVKLNRYPDAGRSACTHDFTRLGDNYLFWVLRRRNNSHGSLTCLRIVLANFMARSIALPGLAVWRPQQSPSARYTGTNR